MGLDGVEIVLEVEDRFGITIRDSESQGVRTVGDLLKVINLRMMALPRSQCPSLGAFLKVRRLFREFLSQPSLRLRPSTKIVSVVPARHRQKLWRTLSNFYDTPPPSLRRPRPLRILLVLIALMAVGLGISVTLVDQAILPVGILLSYVFVFLLHLLTTPFRIEPPSNLTTVGDLSQRFVGLTTATQPIISAEEVLAGVQQIVADILGVDPDEVVPEARFVEDLDLA